MSKKHKKSLSSCEKITQYITLNAFSENMQSPIQSCGVSRVGYGSSERNQSHLPP